MRYAFLAICIYGHALFAQVELRLVHHYNTENGISDNTIHCMKQDSRGFLWIGTKEGLNRFDGFQFKRFFASKDPDHGLPGNTIIDILEYRNGQLLIATSAGLAVYNTLDNVFENERIKKNELKAGSGTLIYSLYKDNKGNVWVNHSGVLDVLDNSLNFVYRFTDLSWARAVKGIILRPDNWFTDKQNRLWLAADTSGIQIIDFSSKTVFNSKHNPQQLAFLKQTFIRSAWLDESTNTLWYAPWGKGLFKYDLANHSQQQVSFGNSIVSESGSVNRITRASDGKILCAGGLGCFTVDEKTLMYKREISELSEITVLFQAANGHIWAGAPGGLFQLENEKKASINFDLYSKGQPVPWVGCSDILRSAKGLLYIANRSNTLVETGKDLLDHKLYPVPVDNTAIITLQQDKQGGIWTGTSTGLYLFDENNKRFSQPETLHPDLLRSYINFIFCDSWNDCWVVTRNPFGLYRISGDAGTCEKINNAVTRHFSSLGVNSRISYMTEDITGKIWMGSRLGGGIICYDKPAGEWNIYPKKRDHKNVLSRGIGFLYADNSNDLWLYDLFGTGLTRYNPETDSVSYITRYDGLPSDFIIAVSPDELGNLWILTEYGITKFHLRENKVVFNSLFRSAPDPAFEYMTYDSLTKSLVFASYNRLQLFPVAALQPASKGTLLPLIDKVWLNNKEFKADVNGLHLKLKPGEKNITIDFTAVHYFNADKIRFAYQLSGADQNWRYPDAGRSAQYAVLTPGKYIFKLKVADENGNWGPEYDSFSFTIVPYFWQTGLFKIAGLLALVAASWILVRRRIKNIRYEAEMKRQISETEMKALRSQMNPHFIFNCLNAIDNLIQTDQKEKATTYLARFAKLIRNTLDSSKNNTVPFQKDLESLDLYLQIEQFRSNNKFEYVLITDPELLHSDFKVPPLVIQPFVENAIHHGLLNKQDGKRKLTVQAKLENNYIHYSVIDNGVGRTKAAEIKELNKPGNRSYGIDITRERLNLHNQDGKDEDLKITDLFTGETPVGTKVDIWIKIYDQP